MIKQASFPTPWLCWAAVSGVLLAWPFMVGFYPDEGYFAEMTARVLRGELPNLDFASNYLGLFYFYNALWFKLLGSSFWSLKTGFLITTAVTYAPLVYGLARQIQNRRWATLSTLLALALTVGINPTVSGNWYALYLSLGSVFLFLKQRNVETDRQVWYLAACGFLLGLTFLMKHSVALYTGFALFYGLLFESLLFSTAPAVDRRHAVPAKITCYLGLLFIPGFSAYLLSPHFSLPGAVFYILPSILLSAFLLRRLGQHPDNAAYSQIFTRLKWITIGFFLPVLVFLIPYLMRGELETLFRQVFVVYPSIYLRVAFVDYLAQGFNEQAFLLLAWLAGSGWLICKQKKPGYAALFIGLAVLMVVAFTDLRGFINLMTCTIIQFPLWAIALGLIVQYRRIQTSGYLREDRNFVPLFLFIWGIVLFWNTYPLGVLFYFAYSSLPLILCLSIFAERLSENTPLMRKIVSGFFIFWILFGLGFAYRQINMLGSREPFFPNQTFPVYLSDPAGRIYVQEDWGRKIMAILTFIQSNSLRPDDIFLMHDEPSIYFLSNHINPTRYSYAIDSLAGDGSDIVLALERHQTRLVFYEPAQNHFNHTRLNDYLNRHFHPKTTLPGPVMVFERKP